MNGAEARTSVQIVVVFREKETGRPARSTFDSEPDFMSWFNRLPSRYVISGMTYEFKPELAKYGASH